MCARFAGAAWLVFLGLSTSGCLAASTAPEGWRRSTDDVKRVARQLLTPDKLTVVVVGKPQGITATSKAPEIKS